MASTSATSGRIEIEPATTSQGMAPSSTSSSPSSSRSLFSCCFDWVSHFLSRRLMESDSMASTSGTTGFIPENKVMGPFHDVAPHASAIVRSSTLIQKPSYDVFINHRGPDVKTTLATRIYEVLRDMKVTAFLDSKELEYGDLLPTTLEATIRGAALHIAIFSERYAESAWCLEELSLMIKTGAKIIPVFYHVEPTDLRYGKYLAAFKKHEKKCRYKTEKLQEWREALSKVSLYSGEIIKNDDDEMRLLKNIVNISLKEIINIPLPVAEHRVGLDETVKDFENTVHLVDGDQGLKIVGIWGMGGSGKTTLSKELYNRRSSSMERSSFIYDIREAKDRLHNKQIQLLKDLGVNETFDSVNQGKAILATHLRRFRVLIVLDDVDHANQLDALLPIKDNLGKGSLIIVTTREREVLTRWGIYLVYKMRALDQINAKQLFCWHAFLQRSPLQGFEELVTNFLEACDGLPLSLKVFGAQLYGNSSKQFWKSLFHKISRILPGDIKDRLRISYDALDHEEKEAFLDIACFFIGQEKSSVVEVWDGSEWSGLYTWERLLNKCLIEVDYKNCVRIHDHLRDLAREIANEHFSSRLWLPQQIINFGKSTEKINDIRGIKVVSAEMKEQLTYREALTPYLAGLKLLEIEEDNFDEEIEGDNFDEEIEGDNFDEVSTELVQIIGAASTELVWLRWSGFGKKNLARLSLKNLRVLQLSGSDCLEELWEAESDAPVQLRELSIVGCPKFQRFPNSIGCLNELKKIVIKGDEGQVTLRSLPEEFCRLQLLEHLELQNLMLSSLPSSFGNLANLQYLDLSGCENLKRLPDSFKNLMRLQYLNLSECQKLILRSDDFQNITLEFLSLAKCHEVKELPRHITNQASLRELDLRWLKESRELPAEIGQLSRLRKLNIGCGLLISLPDSLGDLSSLTHLKISCCDNLKSLPTSLGHLSSLTDLEIFCCDALESLPTSLGHLSSLTHLDILSCDALESLPTSLGHLSSLTYLRICLCSALESLPTSLGDLSCLTRLKINYCRKVEYLPFSVGRLSLLEHFEIDSCPIIQVDFEAPPLSSALSNLKRMKLERTKVCRISIPDLTPRLESLELYNNDRLTEIKALPVKLEWLNIIGSPELVELPSFAQLTSLRKFELRRCDRIERIEGLIHCMRLEILILHTCWEVPGIESLEQMERLKSLELRANKGSAIVSCIQTMQKWPDLHEIAICTGAVPDVSSLVDSFKLGLSPNLSVNEDIFNEDIFSGRPSNGNAVMLCFVINCDSSSQERIDSVYSYVLPRMEIGEGRWACIGFFTQRSGRCFDCFNYWRRIVEELKAERILGVSGEQQSLGEAFLSLVNIL